VAAYLRQRNAGRDAELDAAEIKLRAERRLGELLAEQKKNGERRAEKNRLHDATSPPPTLADLGIEKTAAHRWQAVAKVPAPKFEEYIAGQRSTEDGPLTSKGARAGARITERPERDEPSDPAAKESLAIIRIIDAVRRAVTSLPPGRARTRLARELRTFADALEGK
jgi:hypothetical protein